MSRCLHAYTEPGHVYPAYVSVNERGPYVSIAVRSRGNGGRDCGTIDLTREQVRQLVDDLLFKLGGEG